MPDLEKLRKDLLKMSPDEMLEKLQHIREDRKIKRAPTRKRKAAKKSATTLKDNIVKMLAGMSAEQKEAFMKKLKGDK